MNGSHVTTAWTAPGDGALVRDKAPRPAAGVALAAAASAVAGAHKRAANSNPCMCLPTAAAADPSACLLSWLGSMVCSCQNSKSGCDCLWVRASLMTSFRVTLSPKAPK